MDDRLLYGIYVKGITRACVVCEDPFQSLDTFFSSAVAVWEDDRGYLMVYAPCVQEVLCWIGILVHYLEANFSCML